MGKLGGRPKKLNDEKAALGKKLYANPKNTVEYICKILGVSKPTFYAYLYCRHVKNRKSRPKRVFTVAGILTLGRV